MNILKKTTVFSFLLIVTTLAFGQTKGKLFIIGGGTRSAELIQNMVQTADFRTDDYIVILPMATGEPEETIASISSQLGAYTKNKIVSFNFNKEQADHKANWIDSVMNARLIYVTGGDQNKFMDVVRGTKLFTALHHAYQSGATIAGTSAGAAIMSHVMITGEQKADSGTIKSVAKENIVTSTGMGFLQSAIIDQHFIIRSRYNRLLSVLVDYPTKTLIGVDEGTAIIVKGKDVNVVGDSQVVVVSKPKNIKVNKNGKVSFQQANLSLFTQGENFKLDK